MVEDILQPFEEEKADIPESLMGLKDVFTTLYGERTTSDKVSSSVDEIPSQTPMEKIRREGWEILQTLRTGRNTTVDVK